MSVFQAIQSTVIKFFRSDWFHRAAIMGAGVATYPVVLAMIAIVWKGGWDISQQGKQLDILGNISLGFIGILAVVIIALLGIVRSIKGTLPSGASIDIDLADVSDIRTATSTTTTATTTTATVGAKEVPTP